MTQCLVLPGVGGLAVQGVLAACCLGVFYIKRQKELLKLGSNARTKEEFFLDASKQFAGAGWIHIMNLAFASILNGLMSGGDECEWYFINIMVDTTLGTLVAYVLLKIANAFIRKRFPDSAEEFRSGEYRAEEDGLICMRRYRKQLAVWLVVITCMKSLMVICMFLFSGPLLAFGGFVLGPFLSAPWTKLVVVMICFPLLMDAFQIWMVDNFIKRKEAISTEGAQQDPDWVLRDPEAEPEFVEASADALLAFSARCEEATEEALLSLKASCNEAMHIQSHEVVKQQPANHGKKGQGSNFETQFKFQTIVPPDQL